MKDETRRAVGCYSAKWQKLVVSTIVGYLRAFLYRLVVHGRGYNWVLSYLLYRLVVYGYIMGLWWTVLSWSAVHIPLKTVD